MVVVVVCCKVCLSGFALPDIKSGLCRAATVLCPAHSTAHTLAAVTPGRSLWSELPHCGRVHSASTHSPVETLVSFCGTPSSHSCQAQTLQVCCKTITFPRAWTVRFILASLGPRTQQALTSVCSALCFELVLVKSH